MQKVFILSAIASTMIMAEGGTNSTMTANSQMDNAAKAAKLGMMTEAPMLAKAPMAKDFLIFSNIDGGGQLRPRYEGVNTDNAVRNANARTLRTALSLKADVFQVDGLSILLESMAIYGMGNYFDSTNGATNPSRGAYNLVADPDQLRFTQAYLDYKLSNTLIRVGRQGVNLDDQRFIGTVDWRQMPQTYDAVSITDNSIEGLNVMAAYIWQINRILARDSAPILGSHRGDQFNTASVLLHAAYNVVPQLKITGYGYLLQDIHDTWGIEAKGKVPINENIKLSYYAEYAIQNGPTFTDVIPNADADAHYYDVGATLHMDGFLLGAGYEVLSGIDAVGESKFTTPLSTLHAHNGWSDVLLPGGGNLNEGLVDANIMLGYKAAGFGVFKVLYHDFSSDVGGINYGTEIDAIYKNKIPGVKGLSGMLKGAWFTADEGTAFLDPTARNTANVDRTIIWAMLDYKF